MKLGPAEFCQIFRSFFGQWSFKKKCFWDLQTFRMLYFLLPLCFIVDSPITKMHSLLIPLLSFLNNIKSTIFGFSKVSPRGGRRPVLIYLVQFSIELWNLSGSAVRGHCALKYVSRGHFNFRGQVWSHFYLSLVFVADTSWLQVID